MDHGPTLAVVAVVLVGGLVVSATPAAGTHAGDEPICEYPMTVTDATGVTVEIAEPPDRIVTLAPSAAQTLWEIGAEDRVVGLSMHAAFLDGAVDRENVSADPLSIDLETVVDLEPDLVLAPNVTPPGEVDGLRELGITVYHFETATDVDDVVDKTALTGELVGECAGASATVDGMTSRLDRIDAALEEEPDRPLTYLAMGGGFTPGAGTFQHEVLERAGVTNLADEAGIVGWDVISEEVVVEEDPAWIVYPDSFPEPPIREAETETTAWRENQVVAVDPHNLSQPAPRIVDAIERIHVAVHGEQAVATPTPTPTPSPTPTASPSPTPTAGADPVPGPGLAGAIAALTMLGGAMWLRRR